VIPRQLCKYLLHKCRLWPRLGETAHVEQVSTRESLHVRKRRRQVPGKLIDNLRTPALSLLTFQDVAADLPIQQDQLAIDGKHSPLLDVLDVLLDTGQPGGVIDWQHEDITHSGDLSPRRRARHYRDPDQ
jgi:hypothetical protein